MNVQPLATGGDPDHAQNWGMSIEPPLAALSINSGSGEITGSIPGTALAGNHKCRADRGDWGNQPHGRNGLSH